MKKNIKVHSLEAVEDMKNKQHSSMNKLINALKIDINKYKAEIEKEYNIEKDLEEAIVNNVKERPY